MRCRLVLILAVTTVLIVGCTPTTQFSPPEFSLEGGSGAVESTSAPSFGQSSALLETTQRKDAPLPVTVARTSSSGGSSSSSSSRTCPNCGAGNYRVESGGGYFCVACGAIFGAPARPEPKPPEIEPISPVIDPAE